RRLRMELDRHFGHPLGDPSPPPGGGRARREGFSGEDPMIPGEHPVNIMGNRRVFGRQADDRSAAPAATEGLAVAPWAALVADLRPLLRDPGLHLRMPGPLEPD